MIRVALIIVFAISLPLILKASDQLFYLSFASRILITALAATSLNLVLGYGGMVSFGHAAFVGTGAYVASIALAEGISSAWIGWPAAVLASGLTALIVGAISLRTRGVYFIMITLAFAQMMYYLVNSMKAYGGDEGLTLPARAGLGFGLDLGDEVTFYYVVLFLLSISLYSFSRLIHSRFGRALMAIRENEARAEALGFPTLRYKLIAFAIAGAAGGLAGALLASHGKYVNPNVLHWTQSGTLMVMVILGGVATVWGGLVGAAVLLLLQEVLGAYTEHWEFWTGWVLLAVILFARRGLVGVLATLRERRRRS